MSVLRQRRDNLLDIISDLYDFCAQEVEVVGTDKKDRFEFDVREGGDVMVRAFDSNGDGERDDERPFYERLFKAKETDEIRVYALADDDFFVFSGNHHPKHSGLLLLIALVLFLATPIPMAFMPSHPGRIFAVAHTLVIAAGMYAVAQRHFHVWLGIGLGLVSLVLLWLNVFGTDKGTWEIAMTISLLLFFSFLAAQLFRGLLQPGGISINTVYLAISGFLVIGLIGGLLFEALEIALPGSFPQVNSSFRYFDLNYLSFVTITSLGFGDITPATPAAKSLTMILTLAGQLYLTVLIGVIIGKYLK